MERRGTVSRAPIRERSKAITARTGRVTVKCATTKGRRKRENESTARERERARE